MKLKSRHIRSIRDCRVAERRSEKGRRLTAVVRSQVRKKDLLRVGIPFSEEFRSARFCIINEKVRIITGIETEREGHRRERLTK